MTAEQFYDSINSLQYEANCANLSLRQWEAKMENAKRANIRKINTLVKNLLPGLYYDLCLQYYNPYNYFKTETHLILVHSGIEYFLKINNQKT